MRLFNIYRNGDLFVSQVLARDSEHALKVYLGKYYATQNARHTACSIK